MHSRRVDLLFAFSILAAACGGKIDDGTDSGVDSGAESGPDSPAPPPFCKADGTQCGSAPECCSGACVNGSCSSAGCTPNWSTCTNFTQCCSQNCDPSSHYCVPNGPPPPNCQPNGTACSSGAQCCSQYCSGGSCAPAPPPPPPPPQCGPDGSYCIHASDCCSYVCTNNTCGGNVTCASTSTKLCDQCVATSCCTQMLSCGNDSACSQWLACVQNCEQQGYSAFACTQNTCGMPSTSTEKGLYSCAQQYCSTQCTKD